MRTENLEQVEVAIVIVLPCFLFKFRDKFMNLGLFVPGNERLVGNYLVHDFVHVGICIEVQQIYLF